jgi:hypothetical protein
MVLDTGYDAPVQIFQQIVLSDTFVVEFGEIFMANGGI